MDKPPLPTFVSSADVQDAVMQMEAKADHLNGPWTVWGDEVEPHLTDVDEATMKKFVNEGHADGKLDLYGDNADENLTYEGE